jgi:hypothetical protein
LNARKLLDRSDRTCWKKRRRFDAPLDSVEVSTLESSRVGDVLRTLESFS